MDIVRDKASVQALIKALRAQGKRIAFVPTMGALHKGHLALVARARSEADAVIASIFVNPAQFGPHEDFARYPRAEAQDLALLEQAGVTLAYLPSVSEMYPEGAVTRVVVPGASETLCGASRPGHFSGVATIIAKFFVQLAPDCAVFGEKDYQQLHIIRQMTRDLDLPVRILGVPTLREADGLALSSRNRYLSEEEREQAPALFRILNETKAALRRGGSVETALGDAQTTLWEEGFDPIDYVALCDAATLAPVTTWTFTRPCRLLAAARLGMTRLIDNMEV